MLLMRVLIMEFNNLLFPARFPTRWGLKDAFIALRRVELKTWSDPPNDFQVSRTSRVRHEVAAAEVESRELCQAAHSAASVTVELPARLREAAHHRRWRRIRSTLPLMWCTPCRRTRASRLRIPIARGCIGTSARATATGCGRTSSSARRCDIILGDATSSLVT
jgi:hypothetical protein